MKKYISIVLILLSILTVSCAKEEKVNEVNKPERELYVPPNGIETRKAEEFYIEN